MSRDRRRVILFHFVVYSEHPRISNPRIPDITRLLYSDVVHDHGLPVALACFSAMDAAVRDVLEPTCLDDDVRIRLRAAGQAAAPESMRRV